MADIVAITKYDDNLMQEARRVKTEYLSASKFIRRKNKFWTPRVILTSAAQNKGIGELWNLLTEFQNTMVDNKQFYEKRKKQLALWFWTHLKENLLDILLSKPGMKKKLDELENDVLNGTITPGQANDILINEFNEFIIKKIK